MHHTESTFTSFDGLSIYRQGWLPDGTQRGVVLLFHGLGEHSGRYAHVAAALVDAGYVVHALDHRGHGKSEGVRVYVKTYDEFQRDLLQFRRLVEAEHPGLPVIVMGHSMGGNLAVGHVLDHQPGVTALVLSGPALKLGDSLPKWQVKILLFIAKVAPKLRPQALDASTISRDPAVVAAYVADPLVYSGKVTAGLGAALIRDALVPWALPVAAPADPAAARHARPTRGHRWYEGARTARRQRADHQPLLRGPLPRGVQRARAGDGACRPRGVVADRSVSSS